MKDSNCRDEARHSDEGTEPVRRVVSCDRNPKALGIRPPSLFLLRLMNETADSRPKVLGMIPASELPTTDREINMLKCPMDDGSKPVSLFLQNIER